MGYDLPKKETKERSEPIMEATPQDGAYALAKLLAQMEAQTKRQAAEYEQTRQAVAAEAEKLRGIALNIPAQIDAAIGTNQAGVKQIAAAVAQHTATATSDKVFELLGEASNAIDCNAQDMKKAAASMGRRWLRDVALVIIAVVVSVGSVYYLDKTRSKDIVNGRIFAAIWPKLSKKAQAEITTAAQELQAGPVTAGKPQLPRE